jgi:hypothetical protein
MTGPPAKAVDDDIATIAAKLQAISFFISAILFEVTAGILHIVNAQVKLNAS